MLSPFTVNMVLYGADTTLRIKSNELADIIKYRTPMVTLDGKLMDEYGNVEDEPPMYGTILAIKYSGISDDSQLASNPYTNIKEITKRTKKKGTRVRSSGPYIAGSVELVIYSGTVNNPYNPHISKRNSGKLYAYKNVRLYPATGRAQIPGIVPDKDNPTELLNIVLNYVNRDMNIPIEHAHTIVREKYNMVNSKLSVINVPICTFMHLYNLSEIFNDLRERKAFPFEIVFLTKSHEVCSHMFIALHTPIESNKNRKTTVKIFTSKKINIFGAPSEEITQKICDELDKVLMNNITEVVREESTTCTYTETKYTALF